MSRLNRQNCKDAVLAEYDEEAFVSQEPSYSAMLSVRLHASEARESLEENFGESLNSGLREVLDIPLPSGDKGALLAESIQEEALGILRRRLDEAGIALDQRIVLTLDSGGNICAGEHPARELLEEVARKAPLPGLFRQIAAVALTGRGLEDLRLAQDLLQGGSGEDPLLQACLKGALSHFHLVKTQS